MAGLGHLDVPPELPNALPEHPVVLGPALLGAQGRLFAGLRAALPAALPPPDGSLMALFAVEACRAAVAALAARLGPWVKLLWAALASVRREQHSAQ